ncbi:hypothetical protein RN001_007875 [Aquatica leii]|uniref:Cytochrome P450 n=1 Tax=Aquatica leii TaxID=1421715 RepID=A0AAN7P9I2_9COLE|nr:hypothetical protein RN001_007875 [Aquatica leii]
MMMIAKGCGDNLRTYLEKNIDKSSDIKDVTIRYSTEVISNCAFGVNFNCFVTERNLFAHHAHNIFPKSYMGTFKGFTYIFLPQLVKIFKYQFFDDTSCDFFYNFFLDLIEQRRNLNIKRYDLIDILEDLKKENCEKYDQKRLLSQAISFLAVGHETLSSIVALTIYHLSMNDKIQTRLRDEINDVIEHYGDITPESLADMEYLQMVIHESLRMYPVIQFIQRRCTEDCFIPETGVVLEKDTAVIIPTHWLHYNEKYFPEPHTYNPERFSKEQKRSIDPFFYLPFSTGPRSCLGRRFALMNLKVSVLYFVKHFRIEQDGSEKPIFGSSHSLEPKNRMDIDPIFSNSIFNLKNPQWKDLRSRVSKVFSPSKVKAMMMIAKGCGDNLRTYLEKNIDKPADIKDVTIRYSTEVISNCAFGVNFNCFVTERNLFAHHAHNIFPKSYMGTFKGFTYIFLPQLVKIFKYQFFDDTSCDFFYSFFLDLIEQRRNLNIKRYDLIDILEDLKKENCEKYDQKRLLSQAISFLAVGHETLSSIVALTIYHLSMNDKIQTRLRDEINNVIEHYGDITPESLADMEYLQMVVHESLRMYPVIQFIHRRCTEDCFIPETGVVLEKDTAVIIPTHWLHYNEKYFPEPHTYNPERFSEEQKRSIDPFFYLPFGTGPRSCLGRRFALMNLKVSVLYFVKHFRIEQDGSEKPIIGASHSLEPKNKMTNRIMQLANRINAESESHELIKKENLDEKIKIISQEEGCCILDKVNTTKLCNTVKETCEEPLQFKLSEYVFSSVDENFETLYDDNNSDNDENWEPHSKSEDEAGIQTSDDIINVELQQVAATASTNEKADADVNTITTPTKGLHLICKLRQHNQLRIGGVTVPYYKI